MHQKKVPQSNPCRHEAELQHSVLHYTFTHNENQTVAIMTDDLIQSYFLVLTAGQFLPHELCSVRYLLWQCVCVCVCVCLPVSVTSQSSTKIAKHRNTHATPHGSQGTLVFLCQKSFRNSNGVTPNGAPNAGGVGRSWQISTNNSLYVENGTR